MEGLELGDMGLLDPMGLSISVPDPVMDDGIDASIAAMSSGSAPMSMVESPFGDAFGASPSVSEGLAGQFIGESSAIGFDGGAAASLPDIAVPSPDESGAPSISEAMPSAPPAAFAMPSMQDQIAIPFSDVGLSGGLGGLPGIEIPAPAGGNVFDIGSSAAELMDFSLSIAPPEPAMEGYAMSSDAPAASVASSLGAQEIGDRVAMSLRQLDNAAVAALGPLGSSAPGEAGSQSLGSSISIGSLNLPSANPKQFMSDLLGLSPNGSRHDLSELQV